MLGSDCYLNLGQELIGLMKKWVGIGVRKVIKECEVCGNECGSVSHVLHECLNYSSSRADFLLELQEKLGNGFDRFDSLDSVGKSSFILGSEFWGNCFESLLASVKDYIVNIWERCKLKLFGNDSSQSLSSTEDLGNATGFDGQSGVGVCQGGEPDTQYVYECMLLRL